MPKRFALPTPLYDNLVRLGLKPDRDFEFSKKSDSLMKVHETGVRKLVDKRFLIKTRELHVSMIPSSNGVIETALITAAERNKPAGFWYVILDESGRPVAEHPLVYTTREIEPQEALEHHPPSGNQAVNATGDLVRMLISWLISQDRINDDDITAILEILSSYVESPREITIELKSRQLAQRFHDELLCFEDDIADIKQAAVQAASLREEVALLLTTDTL
jgi:hypothetical protein